MMMTIGVRQLDAEDATPRSLMVTDIGISPAAWMNPQARDD
jgi:hypothetical protein